MAWLVVVASWCSAGEYKIGSEDVLEINLWQKRVWLALVGLSISDLRR